MTGAVRLRGVWLALLLAVALPAAAEEKPAVMEPGCGGRYHHKVAVLQFSVLRPEQFTDIPNLAQGYAAELLLRLAGDHGFLSAGGIRYSLFDTPHDARAIEPQRLASRVRHMAAELGAQFLVTGVVTDGSKRWGALLPSLLPPKERRFEVKLWLFDGYTGTLIAEYQDWEATRKAPFESGGLPVGGSSFFMTPYGQAVDRLLQRQVEVVRDHLVCLPLQAAVTEVEGHEVRIDAGSAAGVRAGDRLDVYHLDLPDLYLQEERQATGNPERLVTRLKIRRAYPQFAVGEVGDELPQTLLAPGDIVRSQ